MAAYTACTIGMVLVIAGIAKWCWPQRSVELVGHIGIEVGHAQLVVRIIGALEVFVGWAAILRIVPLVTSAVGVAILLLFAVVGWRAYHRRKVSCGCFGMLDVDGADRLQYLRTLVLLAVGVAAFAMNLPVPSRPGLVVWRPDPSTALEGVATGIAFVAACSILQQVFTLITRERRVAPRS